MASLDLAVLFGVYLPLFYLSMYVWALICAFRHDEWWTIVFLTLLFFLGWIPPIWGSATYLMLADILIFSAMIFIVSNGWGVVLAVLTLGMVMNNGVFVITGGSEFYRLSVINLLFLIQCLIVIVMGYTAPKLHRNANNEETGIFMAKISRGKV